MPLAQRWDEGAGVIGLWRIEEEEQDLVPLIAPLDQSRWDQGAKDWHPKRRRQWLGARALLAQMKDELTQTHEGTRMGRYGEAIPIPGDWALSITHSEEFAGVYLHPSGPIGIDLQRPHERLFKVASRMLSDEEATWAGDNVERHSQLWTAKEALYKWYTKGQISWKNDLRALPGEREGELRGGIQIAGEWTDIPLRTRLWQGLCLTFTVPR